MKVTNFLIEPNMFVPGEEVTISFTVKAESGDTIGSGGLYVYLGVSGSGETCCYWDPSFTISAGKTKSVSARTVALGSSYASVLGRGTVLSEFGVLLGQYGTRTNVVYPVTVLDARYYPSVALLRLERATGGVPDDEGESLIADLLLGVSSAADISGMTLRLHYSSAGAATVSSPYINLTSWIPDLLAGVNDSAALITRSFSKSVDWYFLLVFGDGYESVQAGCMVARAFANMHLSGSSTGGVCFGGFSTSSAGNPLLESYYPARLYGGVEKIGSGWTYLTPLTGSTPAEFGGGALRCRAVENRRIIAGSLLFQPGSETLALAQLPSGYTPGSTVFSINACSGGRIARITVGGDGQENAGKLACSWVRNLSDGSAYTGGAIWVQCSIEYWVD